MIGVELRQFIGLLAVLALYCWLAFCYSSTIPFAEAPDEWDHFQYSQFVADHGRLPATPAERIQAGRRSDWPPLYHLFLGSLTRWIEIDSPPYLKFRWDKPERRLADTLAADFIIIPTADQRSPYLGVMLAWQLRRWLSIVLSCGTIIVCFLALRTIFPDDPILPVYGAAMAAFIPRFLLISSVLNDDNMLGLLAALFLLLLIKLTKDGDSLWLYAGAGLLAGLAIMAKYSAGLLPIALGVALWLVGRQRGWERGDWLRRVGLSGLSFSLAVGWWFLFVELHFNEIESLGLWAGLLKPVLAFDQEDVTTRQVANFLSGGVINSTDRPSGPSGNIFEWMARFFVTFWGVEKGGQLLDWLNLILVVFMLVLLIGAGVGLWRQWPQISSQRRILLAILLLHIFLFIPFPLIRYVLTLRLSDTAQGRHLLFPTVVAFGIVFWWGIKGWLKPARQRWVAPALAAVFLAWSVASLIGLRHAYGEPLPVHTAPAAVNPAMYQVGRRFGEVLDLMGYDLQPCQSPGVLELTLLWKTLGKVNQDYQTEITLLDESGQVWAQWLGHPGQGRYPTRAWDKGDIVRDTVWLPLTNVPPGNYQIKLRLVGWDGPLKVDQEEALALTTVSLACQVQPASRKLSLPKAGEEAGIRYDLWQDGQIVYRQPTYRYRRSIPITIQNAGDMETRVWLIDPAGAARMPERTAHNLFIFVVGPDWPSGIYSLRAELWRGAAPIAAGELTALLTVENIPRRFEPPPMQHRVMANFADQVRLLGYDLPQRRAAAGESLPITLYWQSLRMMGDNYLVFNHLLDKDQRVWGGEDRLPAETYGTVLWVPQEVVIDSYTVPVAADAPDGVYYLDVGLYQRLKQSVMSLPLVQANQVLDANSVRIGPLKIGGPPPGVVLSKMKPSHPLAVELGGIISLRGYDLALTPTAVKVTFYWQSLAASDVDYTTFVHIRNQAGETVAQMDRPPANGAYPTSLWDEGEIIRDEISIPLEQVQPGTYDLVVGMYDFTNGMRLLIAGSSDNSAWVSQLQVR
jgi:4-amino-4-deoxy-L-arabinose transferase-like glycosyltransferase